MKSKAGRVLLLISGSLTLLFSAGLFSLMLFSFINPFYVEAFVNSIPFNPDLRVVINSNVLSLMFFIFSLLVFIIGALKIYSANLMRYPSSTTKGGIIALVTGFIGGFDLLAIIGGIIAIVQGEKETEKPKRRKVRR